MKKGNSVRILAGSGEECARCHCTVNPMGLGQEGLPLGRKISNLGYFANLCQVRVAKAAYYDDNWMFFDIQ